MKRIILFLTILISGFGLTVNAQQESFSLSLDEAIKLGAKNSLDAFRYKNTYLSGYWEYRYYKADKLPSLAMTSRPVNFDHTLSLDYNYTTKKNEYNLRNYLNSEVSMELNQNVGFTGGTLSLTSDLGMAKNFAGDKSTTYLASPVNINYSQSINGYNDLKWKSKLEPLKYKKAKKEFIQNQENLAMKSTSMFFDLVEAQIQLKIAYNSLANADTLYKIGKGRFQVGTVTQDELLNLELNQLNAVQALSVAKLEVMRSQSGLNSYLMLNKQTQINCVVPAVIPELQIIADEALVMALKNNPDIIDQEQQMLEQDRQVAKVKAENGINASINANYGLSGSSGVIDNVYDNPGNSQRVIVGLSVPLVDWGRRKGQRMMAESDREVVSARVEQARTDFEQNIIQSVMEFNIQAEQVRNAAKADTVSQKGYDVTFQRFLIGKVDVIKLNIARNDRESARNAYIRAVRTYWNYYYRLRMLTLYDFVKAENLTAEYDEIIEN